MMCMQGEETGQHECKIHSLTHNDNRHTYSGISILRNIQPQMHTNENLSTDIRIHTDRRGQIN